MKRGFVLVTFVLLVSLALPAVALAQVVPPQPPVQPTMTLDLTQTAGSTMPVQVLVLLTLLSFIPAILISMTCFTRLIVVFHFLRQAMGSPEAPNNQVLLGLSLFITLFVMAPVLTRVNAEALQPMLAGQITQTDAIARALIPLRSHMLKHTRERDLALFIRLSGNARPRTADDVPTVALIPAYMISELKTAFQIGFVLFIPFLVIDMAVSSVLLSMGMMQLPPVIVSMPLKILLFVMVDGWYLIVGSLVKSLL
ncbi:MAG: flagellar type III secretion system pore protein FliP [Pyrinomonadaceae bacterium]